MRRRIDVTTDETTEMQTDQNPESAGTGPANDGETISSGAEDYITALQAELEEARTRADDAEKAVLYTQAEFSNYRRRRDEEQIGLKRFMNSEVIVSLLPVMDNFERALKSAEKSRNVDALLGGIASTLKQFQAILEKAGVKPIEAVGKEFDPNFHEAIGHAEETDLPANTVAEEVQRGYVMHDRVLRPSLVKVSQG